MLEELDRIDWARAHHAYGSAADVPRLLRQLASPDDKTREAAAYELYGNIWNQGTIYEATALAVPFLFELMLDPSTPDREVIGVLLGLIARGDPPAEQGEAVVTKAREAIASRIPAVLGLVKAMDAEPDLALAAAHIAACFGEDPETVPALRGLLQRLPEARARATVGLALAVLGDPQPSAFVATGIERELMARLGTLAGAVGNFDRDFILDIVLDLATGEFEESALDGLGV